MVNKMPLLAILLGIFGSCQNKPGQPSTFYGQPDTAAKHAPVSLSFAVLLDRVLEANLEEEALYGYLIDSFYTSKNPEPEAYAMFFRYLLKSKDETFSESSGLYLFEMLEKYKAKGVQIIKYVHELDAAEQKRIMARMAGLLCLELNSRSYNIKKLKKDFYYLSDTVFLEKAQECFDNWVE